MSIKVAIAGVGGFGYMYVDHFCRLVETGKVELVAAFQKFSERYRIVNSFSVFFKPVTIVPFFDFRLVCFNILITR